MSKDVSFSGKPPSTADERVDRAFAAIKSQVAESKIQEPSKRICVDVPQSLHSRVKIECARSELSITEVLREFLEKRFPELD